MRHLIVVCIVILTNFVKLLSMNVHLSVWYGFKRIWYSVFEMLWFGFLLFDFDLCRSLTWVVLFKVIFYQLSTVLKMLMIGCISWIYWLIRQWFWNVFWLSICTWESIGCHLHYWLDFIHHFINCIWDVGQRVSYTSISSSPRDLAIPH